MKITASEQREIFAINMTLRSRKVCAWIDVRSRTTLQKVRFKTPGYIGYVLTRFGPNAIADAQRAQAEMQEAISGLRRTPTPVRIGVNPLCIEVPRVDSQTKPLLHDHYNQGLREFEAVIGRSYTYGRPETQTLYLPSSNQAHTLIAGMNGSGKSNVAQCMILSMAYNASPQRLHMLMIDPKNRSLVPLKNLPHVRAWTCEPGEAQQIIAWVGQEIVRRRDGDAPSPEPRTWIIIEELSELASYGVDLQQLESTARMGRELGVHILALAQKPTRGTLGDQLMSQFNVRVIGLMQNAQDAYWATGYKDSGAESLPGRGSMLVVRDGGKPVRVQSYFVDEPQKHVAAVCDRWAGVSVLPLDLSQFSHTINDGVSVLHRNLEKVRPFLSDNFDWQRGKLRHGAKQGLIWLLFGEGANTTGDNDRHASAIVEMFKEESYAS